MAYGRRGFIRRAGLAVGAGVTMPVAAGGPVQAASVVGRGDRLFEMGRFAEADKAYERVLARDPANAHAVSRRGYIALLSNRFTPAQRFLEQAVKLAPRDTFSMQLLSDCFVRQDRFAEAAPWTRAYGNVPVADQHGAISGHAYQINGPSMTRIPFQAMDPLPLVEASVRGGAPGRFLLDTGATTVGLSTAEAERAGLEAVSMGEGSAGGQTFTMYYGILDSFRIGDFELSNLPVHWNDAERPTQLGDPQPAGIIGTHVLYHFLATIDYKNRALVLRRLSRLREFQAAARRARVRPLPLWLAGDHFPCTLGSINGHGPTVATMDTGGANGTCIGLTEDMAKRIGIRIDYDRPTLFNRIVKYPCVPDEARLGNAVGRHLHGIAGPPALYNGFGFETIANFTHSFFKPYAITFDFQQMGFYIAPKAIDS